MFYKVIKDNKVIDVLDHLTYLKWQPKHKIWILSDENEAQAILLSDKNTIVHERTLYNVPTEVNVDVVDIEQINKFEYEQLRVLNMKTPEAIVDELILYMVENHILQQ